MDDEMTMHIVVHAAKAEAVRWYARHEIGLGDQEPAWENIERQLARQSKPRYSRLFRQDQPLPMGTDLGRWPVDELTLSGPALALPEMPRWVR